jgi:hypothetical protein
MSRIVIVILKYHRRKLQIRLRFVTPVRTTGIVTKRQTRLLLQWHIRVCSWAIHYLHSHWDKQWSILGALFWPSSHRLEDPTYTNTELSDWFWIIPGGRKVHVRSLLGWWVWHRQNYDSHLHSLRKRRLHLKANDLDRQDSRSSAASCKSWPAPAIHLLFCVTTCWQHWLLVVNRREQKRMDSIACLLDRVKKSWAIPVTGRGGL